MYCKEAKKPVRNKQQNQPHCDQKKKKKIESLGAVGVLLPAPSKKLQRDASLLGATGQHFPSNCRGLSPEQTPDK
jgi:hypothetical protein